MASGAGNSDGLIFSQLTFFVGQRVPTRSLYIDRLRRNGGKLVPLEKDAQIMIADHFRREQNPTGSISYEWIDKSIAAGRLQDLDAHSAGPAAATARPVGGLKPAKSSRTPYSNADDEVLWRYVKAAERRGLSTKGNEIFKQLEISNKQHPWQSWRHRWIKYVAQKSYPEETENGDEQDVPSPPASAAPTRSTQKQPRSGRSVSADVTEDEGLPAAREDTRTNPKKSLKPPPTQDLFEIPEASTTTKAPRTVAPGLSTVKSSKQSVRSRRETTAPETDDEGLQPVPQTKTGVSVPMAKAQKATRIPPPELVETTESIIQSREFSISPASLPALREDSAPEPTLSAARSSEARVAEDAGPFSTFTEDEHDNLLANAKDVEMVAMKNYDKAWKKWATHNPQHTAAMWKRYYEEIIRPEYYLTAIETEDESIEAVDDDEGSARDGVASVSVSSSFVEVMKVKSPKSVGTTPTSNTKRKRDEEESSSNSQLDRVPESNTKKARIHPDPVVVDIDSIGSSPPNEEEMTTPRANLAVAPPPEEQDDEEMDVDVTEANVIVADDEVDDNADDQARHSQVPTDVHAVESQQSWRGFSPEKDDEEPSVPHFEAQESQESWKGFSPEKDLEAEEEEAEEMEAEEQSPGFKLYEEDDEVVEDGEENQDPEGEEVIMERKHHPHLGALQDVTHQVVAQQETQETQSTEEWHDASEGSIRTRSMQVAPVPTPDLLKRKARPETDTISESDEEDLEARLHDMANNPSAQLLRESAQRDEEEAGNEQGLANGDDGEDEEVIEQIYHEEESIDGDAESEPGSRPATAAVHDVPIFDSDQILPDDESQADSDNLPSPTPRKKAAQPEDLMRSRDASVSDIEDYTIVAPVPESDPALPDIDDDQVLPDNGDDDPMALTEADYLDTQGILQAETQALDTDMPLPPSTQDLNGWLEEQNSKVPDSDASFAPSSPGFQRAPTPPASRKRADLAAAARQRRESSSALALGEDIPPFQRSDQRSPSPTQLPQIPEDEDDEESDNGTEETEGEAEGTPIVSPAKVIISWMNFERTRGNTEELMQFALQRTSANTTLASLVLDSMRKRQGLPKNTKGIWSEEDDQLILEILEQPEDAFNRTYAIGKEKLIKLHGRDAYTRRLQLLLHSAR